MAARSHSAGPTPILYGATVFLSSAVLLVLEIAAGRLIAPYVGVSLYTWTSIIGVILAGLSLGSWLGGVWADRGAGHRAAGVALGLGAVTTLAVLAVLTVVAPVVQESGLSLLGASFAFVASLFFVPAVLLGVITPLLTTLALRVDERAGHVVGRMHALAALGSIAGTFAAGYWLIQHLGTRNVLLASAATLAVLAAPFLARRGAAAAVALLLSAAVVAGVTQVRNGFANPCTTESQYYCIRVVDASAEVPFGVAHGLVLDHLLHGINHATEPGMLAASYLHLIDELALGYLGERAARAHYFYLGGGAYTHPRAMRALAPQARLTVAELDPEVTRVARESLQAPLDGVTVLHADARVALGRFAGPPIDVVIADVYQDLAVPYHLLTREFNALVRARLAPGGLYLLNVVDAWPDPLLVKSILRTLREDFRYVHAWVESMPGEPTRMTYVLSATDIAEPPQVLRAQRGFEREWRRVTARLETTGAPPGSLPVLSDDFVPVERLVAPLITTGLGL